MRAEEKKMGIQALCELLVALNGMMSRDEVERVAHCIKRAAFERGAKAQREADTRFLQAVRDEMPDARAFKEYDEDEKDEIQARAIHIGEAIIRLTGWKDGLAAAPLVKFEEECGEQDQR